jgi:hypothetical protein
MATDMEKRLAEALEDRYCSACNRPIGSYEQKPEPCRWCQVARAILADFRAAQKEEPKLPLSAWNPCGAVLMGDPEHPTSWCTLPPNHKGSHVDSQWPRTNEYRVATVHQAQPSKEVMPTEPGAEIRSDESLPVASGAVKQASQAALEPLALRCGACRTEMTTAAFDDARGQCPVCGNGTVEDRSALPEPSAPCSDDLCELPRGHSGAHASGCCAWATDEQRPKLFDRVAEYDYLTAGDVREAIDVVARLEAENARYEREITVLNAAHNDAIIECDRLRQRAEAAEAENARHAEAFALIKLASEAAVAGMRSAEQECDTLRRALEQAREALEDGQGMTKIHDEVPQWMWPDYSRQMRSIRRHLGRGNAAALAALDATRPAERTER